MKGSTTSEVLGQLYSRFCGCTYISGSLTIQLTTGPLTEDSFNSLYYLREISGYLSFRNIPQVASVTLPNLRIIRGQTTLSSSTGPVALAVENSYIGSLNLPSLTEISNGGATFVSTNGMCGILNVNWTDILNNGQFDYSMSGCTTPSTGNYKLAVMWESCDSHVMHLVHFFLHASLLIAWGPDDWQSAVGLAFSPPAIANTFILSSFMGSFVCYLTVMVVTINLGHVKSLGVL